MHRPRAGRYFPAREIVGAAVEVAAVLDAVIGVAAVHPSVEFQAGLVGLLRDHAREVAHQGRGRSLEIVSGRGGGCAEFEKSVARVLEHPDNDRVDPG